MVLGWLAFAAIVLEGEGRSLVVQEHLGLEEARIVFAKHLDSEPATEPLVLRD